MLGCTVIDAGDSVMLLQQLSTYDHGAPNLMELIRLTTKHLATDPRDMLYALLRIKDIVDFGGVTVDISYEEPFREYTATSSRLLYEISTSFQSLEMLVLEIQGIASLVHTCPHGYQT